MLLSELTPLGGRLALADWGIIAAYLLATTVLGARLAGRQATIRDFFLGGRSLPWWAVSVSIIATEISAVTFVAVPTISYAEQGNLTYLQLAIGAILARIIIGVWFVPRYFEREIYSPYDYMGQRLGGRVKKVATALFMVGAVLGQGARVYVTAFVLGVVTGLDLTTSIWIIGAFSICWTLLGGMTTVIWTDVIQFCVLTLGACLVLGYAISAVGTPVTDVIASSAEAGKFQCLDLRTNPALSYTLWCGLLATPFLNLAAFGTDQVMAQRMFCCRNRRDATKAIIVSSVGIGVALLMLCVGIALYAYFRHEPFMPREAELYHDKNTYLLPIFMVRALPTGIRGLIIAAVFASAISTLDSALAALSQSTVSAFFKARPTGGRRRGRLRKMLSSEVGLSKACVVGWGVVLCLMATACIGIADHYDNAVDLAFALVGYTYGPLLGILLLALLPVKCSDAGLIWAVPMTVLAIFGLSHHDLDVTLIRGLSPIDLADWVVWLGVGVILVLGLLKAADDEKRLAAIVVGALAIVLLHQYRVETDAGDPAGVLAWPWRYPIGTAMTFGLGYCLGRPGHGAQGGGGATRPRRPKHAKKTKRGRPAKARRRRA